MVDALVSGTSDRKIVEVQVLLSAPLKKYQILIIFLRAKKVIKVCK